MFGIIDILIFINLYGLYIIPPAFVGGIFYSIRYMTFPLMTRSPLEMVLIFGPHRVKFYKVTQRLKPMFETRKGAYWFGNGGATKFRKMSKKRTGYVENDPIGNLLRKRKGIAPPDAPVESEYKELPFASNRVHIYHESINQEIDNIEERIPTKLADVMTHFVRIKQLAVHAVQLPPSMMAFSRNWLVTIDEDGTYWCEPTRTRQPLKVNFWTRIGIVLPVADKADITVNNEATTENAVSYGNQQVVTIQRLEQKIGSLEKNSNYDAFFALEMIKTQRFMAMKWVRKLMGIIDLKPILIMMAALGAIIMIVLFVNPSDLTGTFLPPPPEGCLDCELGG